MRSRASVLAAVLLAGCGAGGGGAPPGVIPPPSATGAQHEQDFDQVGYAGRLPGATAGVAVALPALPPGTIVEVTALKTGRTALALVVAGGPADRARLADLSSGAARTLGLGDVPIAPVRVRSVVANPGDRAALLAGGTATARLNQPPAVIAALKRKLSGAPAANLPLTATPLDLPLATDVARPHPPTPASRIGDEGAKLYVQLAAFSTEERARGVAKKFGGRIDQTRGLWRVRLGPFPNAAAAQRARDGAAAAGYGDARIVRAD